MQLIERMRDTMQLTAEKPDPALLPTLKQLRRSTIAAAIGAVFIGVGVYLPAEYGIDPTGVGSVLGLTEMGEIKQQLAREAAEGPGGVLLGGVVAARDEGAGHGRKLRRVEGLEHVRVCAGLQGLLHELLAFVVRGDQHLGVGAGLLDRRDRVDARQARHGDVECQEVRFFPTSDFDRLVAACRDQLDVVETGKFGANMQVSLVNDGPVTFWLES